MKLFASLLILSLVFSACDKDDVDPNTESNGLFTTTSTSFSELDLTQINNGEMFVMNLDIDDDANGLTIDLNGDGVNDLRIVGDADQDWVGTSTIKSSNLGIVTLNSNTFVLRDSVPDSTFNLTTIDTNSLSIDYYQLVSSYQESGSVLTSETMNSYVTDVDSTSIVLSNDSRWTYFYTYQAIRNHYKNTTDHNFGPDSNGYYLDVTDVIEYSRGIVQNYTVSWIPIKFITDEGNVKMGFIKLKPRIYTGFMNVGVDCWGIQR
jgi:hypothetical protein